MPNVNSQMPSPCPIDSSPHAFKKPELPEIQIQIELVFLDPRIVLG